MLLVLKTPSNLKDWYSFAAEPTEAMRSRTIGFKKTQKIISNYQIVDIDYNVDRFGLKWHYSIWELVFCPFCTIISIE